MTRYVLPDLPYDFAALEPHISARIMELHHGKHHRAYVEGANTAIEKMLEARHNDRYEEIAALERAIAFNVSGHVLHSIFWNNLRPGSGGPPAGEVAEALDADFGGYERFKKQIIKAASTIMGSGWAALVYDPVLKRLGTSQIHDHQSQTTQGSVPLLVIDVWEHAYYLQYQTDKAKYFDALFQLFNWDDVAERLAAARLLDLRLANVADTSMFAGADLTH